MNDLTRQKHKSNVIYDFDGTLAIIHIDWSAWHNDVREIFKKYDPAFNVTGRVHTYQNDMIKRCGPQLRDELNHYNEQYEVNHYQGLTPNLALIDHLKTHPHQQHHLLTSQNRLLLNKLLTELRLTSYFTHIVTRDDVTFIKPDPEGMRLIVGNQPVSEWIYLGDAGSDEAAAKAVGVDFEYIRID